MLDTMRLVGSLAIHALLAVLLVSIHRAAPDGGDAPHVELVEITTAPPPPSPPPPVTAAAATRVASGGSSARRGARRNTASHAPVSLLGDLRIEPVGDGRRDGDGDGDGAGLGLGDGLGLADLVPVVPTVPAPPSAPPAPHVSKARPARLIYPSRQTEVEDSALFVADVIVDDEGFVVGARLARGTNGPRDAEAGAAVWRFRYDPARDDDGVRVRSTVQQKFAVAW